MSTCLVAAGGTLSRVIEPNLGNSGSSMMALWQGWLRRATPPVTATAAVGELLLGLSLKLNLFPVWGILPETVLPSPVFDEMLW